MTGVAAPLLASVAVAFAGIIVSGPASLRWPGLALVPLVVSAALLIAAVQFGFLARRHVVTAADVAAELPMLRGEQLARRITVEREAAAPYFELWADYGRWAYGLGIIALWAGVGVAVAPPPFVVQPGWRWAAAGLCGLLALLELGWLVVSRLRPAWFTPERAVRRWRARHGS